MQKGSMYGYWMLVLLGAGLVAVFLGIVVYFSDVPLDELWTPDVQFFSMFVVVIALILILARIQLMKKTGRNKLRDDIRKIHEKNL